MTSKRYLAETQDQRDGGRHIVECSIIDERTGIKVRTKVATFEPECGIAAKEYADWLNKSEGCIEG